MKREEFSILDFDFDCLLLHYTLPYWKFCLVFLFLLEIEQYIVLTILERFSFERRKVIGFAITMPHDWLKKLAPHFHPIRSKTKTNRDSLARVFPSFASATCNCYEF